MTLFQQYRHRQIERIRDLAQHQAILLFTHKLYCRDGSCYDHFLLAVGARELYALADDLVEVNR